MCLFLLLVLRADVGNDDDKDDDKVGDSGTSSKAATARARARLLKTSKHTKKVRGGTQHMTGGSSRGDSREYTAREEEVAEEDEKDDDTVNAFESTSLDARKVIPCRAVLLSAQEVLPCGDEVSDTAMGRISCLASPVEVEDVVESGNADPETGSNPRCHSLMHSLSLLVRYTLYVHKRVASVPAAFDQRSMIAARRGTTVPRARAVILSKKVLSCRRVFFSTISTRMPPKRSYERVVEGVRRAREGEEPPSKRFFRQRAHINPLNQLGNFQ